MVFCQLKKIWNSTVKKYALLEHGRFKEEQRGMKDDGRTGHPKTHVVASYKLPNEENGKRLIDFCEDGFEYFDWWWFDKSSRQLDVQSTTKTQNVKACDEKQKIKTKLRDDVRKRCLEL